MAIGSSRCHRDHRRTYFGVDMPQASRFVHILAAFAENEAEAISKRTKAALKGAKARGTVLGGVGYPQNGCGNRRGGSAGTQRLTSIRPTTAAQQFNAMAKSLSETRSTLHHGIRDCGYMFQSIASAAGATLSCRPRLNLFDARKNQAWVAYSEFLHGRFRVCHPSAQRWSPDRRPLRNRARRTGDLRLQSATPGRLSDHARRTALLSDTRSTGYCTVCSAIPGERYRRPMVTAETGPKVTQMSAKSDTSRPKSLRRNATASRYSGSAFTPSCTIRDGTTNGIVPAD